MATLFELDKEGALTTMAYNVCGITVTYTGVTSGATSIVCIPDNASDQFAAQFGAQTAEQAQSCRVQKSDVATPYRGDTITNANGVIYVVEDFEQQNEAEWNLILRICDRG